jgi:thiamine pyrophosphokinase
MPRAIIFANGWMNLPSGFLNSFDGSDFIIAADGGAKHCDSLGITPDVIIGDFDSLESERLSSYQQNGVEVKKYPTSKDDTDLELALKLAIERGYEEVFVIAALGDRWDMSIANILLLAKPAISKLNIHLLDGSKELFLIRGECQIEIQSIVGSRLSLLPLAGDASGITTRGLEYPLENETLYFGSSRGVSNVFIQNSALIKVRKGLLLCIYDKAE